MPGLPLGSPVSVLLVPFFSIKTLLYNMSEEAPTVFPVVTGLLLVSGCPFPAVTHLSHSDSNGTAAGTTMGE